MRRIAITALSLLAIGSLAFSIFAQNNEELKKIETPRVRVDALMQAKLTNSQELLKGLALEDFESIEKQAQSLELLSLDTDWNIIQSKEYAHLSKDFREAARSILRAAKKENVDAAAWGYMKLTMSCIECHQKVRADKN